MFGLTIIVGMETLLFVCILHLIFKYGFRYRGVFIESIVIAVSTIPGIGGCGGRGGAVGLPMPLIVGMPLDLVIQHKDCGWMQGLLFDDRYRTTEYFGFPIGWAIICGVFIFFLYKNRRQANNSFQTTSETAWLNSNVGSPKQDKLRLIAIGFVLYVGYLVVSGHFHYLDSIGVGLALIAAMSLWFQEAWSQYVVYILSAIFTLRWFSMCWQLAASDGWPRSILFEILVVDLCIMAFMLGSSIVVFRRFRVRS